MKLTLKYAVCAFALVAMNQGASGQDFSDFDFAEAISQRAKDLGTTSNGVWFRIATMGTNPKANAQFTLRDRSGGSTGRGSSITFRVGLANNSTPSFTLISNSFNTSVSAVFDRIRVVRESATVAHVDVKIGVNNNSNGSAEDVQYTISDNLHEDGWVPVDWGTVTSTGTIHEFLLDSQFAVGQGSTKLSLDANGNLTVTGNITASGSLNVSGSLYSASTSPASLPAGFTSYYQYEVASLHPQGAILMPARPGLPQFIQPAGTLNNYLEFSSSPHLNPEGMPNTSGFISIGQDDLTNKYNSRSGLYIAEQFDDGWGNTFSEEKVFLRQHGSSYIQKLSLGTDVVDHSYDLVANSLYSGYVVSAQSYTYGPSYAYTMEGNFGLSATGDTLLIKRTTTPLYQPTTPSLRVKADGTIYIRPQGNLSMGPFTSGADANQ